MLPLIDRRALFPLLTIQGCNLHSWPGFPFEIYCWCFFLLCFVMVFFFGSLPVNPGHSSGIFFDIRRWHSHELVLNWIKTKRASSAHVPASLWLAGVSLTAKQGLARILISEWKCWVMASLISVQRVSLFPAFPMFYTPNASWQGFEIK